MELIKNDHSDIPGWGVDADKKVRPNYPMWKVPEKGTGAHWPVPDQQPNFKDYFSIERPGPTHVFGTSVPPSLISGFIRTRAFRYSEGSWGHWILLLMADRVNVYEGLVKDLLQGIRPRLLEERGWNVDKKFKTKRYKRVMLLSTLALMVPLALVLMKKDETTTK